MDGLVSSLLLLLLLLLFGGVTSIWPYQSLKFWSKILRLISRLSNQSPNNTALGSDGFPEQLRRELMPRHVAVILDGNRRWAKEKGLTFIEGYRAGFVAFRVFVGICVQWDIPIVSLFLFSSENWRRPQISLRTYLHASRSNRETNSEIPELGVRVSVIGDTCSLPISLQELIKETEKETEKGTKCHLILAMSYGGQNDIVQACQGIATKVKHGFLEPEDITRPLVEQELQTRVTNVPSPDLLIRTSGELRISNYYLWQSAYTEMYFTTTYWPDFDRGEFIEALLSFQQRGRHFGRN
ncbi:hypothetical protein Cgig2_021963 [Carnegiea gigantea]|uniref:Alkyl transferase n=1 Tax=Carnegiea gigantea TaxID=171969 RepID=A0A9Q1QQ78_9CARY|nr:hypothetical protein Cgig2_021963 [Carnegiea gigantea]